MTPTHARRIGPIIAASALAISLAGCAGSRQTLQGVAYPTGAPRTAQLDVQVFRRGTNLEFTNTTARALAPGRLWLNMWYSLPVEGVGVGETVSLPIGEFRDEHGRAMRAGGFFATRAAEPIATAELQQGDELLRLVYVREPER